MSEIDADDFMRQLYYEYNMQNRESCIDCKGTGIIFFDEPGKMWLGTERCRYCNEPPIQPDFVIHTGNYRTSATVERHIKPPKNPWYKFWKRE